MLARGEARLNLARTRSGLLGREHGGPRHTAAVEALTNTEAPAYRGRRGV